MAIARLLRRPNIKNQRNKIQNIKKRTRDENYVIAAQILKINDMS